MTRRQREFNEFSEHHTTPKTCSQNCNTRYTILVFSYTYLVVVMAAIPKLKK